jgi:hypothetical protein
MNSYINEFMTQKALNSIFGLSKLIEKSFCIASHDLSIRNPTARHAS